MKNDLVSSISRVHTSGYTFGNVNIGNSVLYGYIQKFHSQMARHFVVALLGEIGRHGSYVSLKTLLKIVPACTCKY